MPEDALDSFADEVLAILVRRFGPDTGHKIFHESLLIGYIVLKTRAANRGSKSRGSFANLYAIYVLVEDYIAKGYVQRSNYSEYEGARFSQLMIRQRQLPFGEKLQNHALNNRLNDEFHKFYPDEPARPILRDVATQRYWITEPLLVVHDQNIAEAIIEIIDKYVETRRDRFTEFISDCQQIDELDDSESQKKVEFVASLLQPTTDARIFEIVSFAIMKAHYGSDTIWIGPTRESVEEQILRLYKTGRTNANDGGIDFVMRPLGRFFQVTETLDLKKYFLDIDKVQRFPITFVIKTELESSVVRDRLRAGAEELFGVQKVVDAYMAAVEEVVTIPQLLQYLEQAAAEGKFSEIISEIILHSRVEFNLDDDEEAMLRAMTAS
ncbi:restriction endonuclease [Mycobacterium persicum]|nr:restriction endonuclease [Mycobacterium persicum]KZS84794.1 restriction endonuclease [Mycobacterium persicum]ORB95990.1 restriction endonuclease [Mycobacterium persicum]ORC08007.1 restriction endonuclease [Mycobacterium persicum]